MSIQDDYFDLKKMLWDRDEEILLERIWCAFCVLETEDMLRRGEISPEEFNERLAKRMNIANKNYTGVDS
jgi:hypothetical protein